MVPDDTLTWLTPDAAAKYVGIPDHRTLLNRLEPDGALLSAKADVRPLYSRARLDEYVEAQQLLAEIGAKVAKS